MIRLVFVFAVIAGLAVVLVWVPMSRMTAGGFLLSTGFVLGLALPRVSFRRRRSE
jgi:hypothetical protein